MSFRLSPSADRDRLTDTASGAPLDTAQDKMPDGIKADSATLQSFARFQRSKFFRRRATCRISLRLISVLAPLLSVLVYYLQELTKDFVSFCFESAVQS